MTIHELKAKWGTEGAGLLIGAFVERAPEFPGDLAMATKLGEFAADLQSALETLPPQQQEGQ